MALRPVRAGATAPTSTPPTWCSRPTATAASPPRGAKYYIGNGNVAGDRLRVRPPRRRRGPGRYVFFAADSRHPATSWSTNVVARADVRQRVPAGRLPGARRGRAAHRPGRPSTPRSTPSTSASSTCATARSASASTPSTRRSPTRTTASSTATRSPTSRTCGGASSTPTPGWSAMKLFSDRAVDYLRSACPDDRRYLLFNPMTKMKVTTEGEQVIDLLLGRDRRQGLREGHLLRPGRRYIRGAAASSRARCT